MATTFSCSCNPAIPAHGDSTAHCGACHESFAGLTAFDRHRTGGTCAELDATPTVDGRGWSNKDRNSAYDRLDADSLLERLASWSPVVRERAARAGELEAIAHHDALDGLDAHQRTGQPRVETPVPLTV